METIKEYENNNDIIRYLFGGFDLEEL